MTDRSEPDLLELVTMAFGQVRAEYEADGELYRRFAMPLYFKQLLGVTPSFLVGGRGTGKTTTLRSMSFRGQTAICGSHDPSSWRVIGAYWKVEPSVVSVFRQKGIQPEVWAEVFTHYLNLRLSSLVLDYAVWLTQAGIEPQFDTQRIALYSTSMGLESAGTLAELATQVDLAIADVESKVNGRISELATSARSVLGKPLDYLFSALRGLGVSRTKPFMFCLDEYENLSSYQQVLVNTLVKQVGSAPYTFKIGVRNSVAIDRSTMISGQPLQEPADFTTVDIVTVLKDESFEDFAAMVVEQRLRLISPALGAPSELLPALSIEEEADLLGAEAVKLELLSKLEDQSVSSPAELAYAQQLSNFDACMILRWARSHGEEPLSVLRFSRSSPGQWKTRCGNYGYAMLFTIRERRVGERKYYTGWKTYCQLADGNIRYMIRLVYEALRLHVVDGGILPSSVSTSNQTRAASRVGETTIRDLQGWSRQGAALTRLALGLGSIFESLARDAALTTPEVTQFRVRYPSSEEAMPPVDDLLAEAVGQGILIAFDGDKNARSSGATKQPDYQLHPVLAPYFVYGSRRGRRMMITAADLQALTQRGLAASAVRRILADRQVLPTELPAQLTIFEG